MGTEEFWVPAVIAAVGAGAQQVDAHNTAQRQDEQAAQGIRIQGADQQKADTQVAQNIQKLQGSSPEAARANAANAFITQLRRNSAESTGVPVAGGSARYKGDIATSNQNITDYGNNLADTQASILAPNLQRQAEGQNSQQLAANLSEIGRQSQANAFLSQLRMRGITNNPWAQAGGSILEGVGNGMASSGYGSGDNDQPINIDPSTGQAYIKKKV